MNPETVRTLVMEAIQTVAPEMEASDIDPDENLREECDIDSMDFLNFLSALKKISGVSIPETDYPKVDTLNKMIEYLNEK